MSQLCPSIVANLARQCNPKSRNLNLKEYIGDRCVMRFFYRTAFISAAFGRAPFW
jgi:hypothetical protein